MATPADAIARAARELGTTEDRDGGTPYHDWYGAPHSWAWCCIFVSWVLKPLGVPVGPNRQGSAWVSGLRDWYANMHPGSVLRGTGDARPGDLVCFEWGTTPGGYDHIGLIELVQPDHLVCIEGNTQNAVRRHRRPRWSGIPELIRPAYTPAPAPPEGEPDVQARQLLIRDLRPGRHGATYLTTVFDNPPGVTPDVVGSGIGGLLPDGATVEALERAGVQRLDTSDPVLLASLAVIRDNARDVAL